MLFLCLFTCKKNKDSVHRLKNGLEIVYREIPDSHVSTILVTAKAGSILENDDIRGVAYLTSRCLFRQSEHFSDIQKYLDSFGARYKSNIIPDFCRYSFTFGDPFLDSMVIMINDAIQNPNINQSLFQQVKERSKLTLLHQPEMPKVYLEKYLLKHAYQVHPYRFSAIPDIEALDNISLSDVMQFTENVYIPKNIKIILTGSRESRRAVRQLSSLLESWNKNPTQSYSWKQEPQQKAPKVIQATHEFGTSFAFVTVGWRAPSIINEDTYVFDVILASMGMGESSRLNKHIRNKFPSVYYIWAEYLTPREPGYFIVHAICEPDDAQLVLKQIKHEIDILKMDAMNPIEIERAQKILEAQEAFTWEHTENAAQYIGYWTIMKDYSFAKNYMQNIRNVTSEEIHSTANKYFKDDQSISIILLPKQGEEE